MRSDIEMSTEADSALLCSTLKYSNRVEYLGKRLKHLRGDAFSKLQNIRTAQILSFLDEVCRS